eukprot:scaffold61274_cov23-Tisochrysis_lutea.AAC.1
MQIDMLQTVHSHDTRAGDRNEECVGTRKADGRSLGRLIGPRGSNLSASQNLCRRALGGPF